MRKIFFFINCFFICLPNDTVGSFKKIGIGSAIAIFSVIFIAAKYQRHVFDAKKSLYMAFYHKKMTMIGDTERRDGNVQTQVKELENQIENCVKVCKMHKPVNLAACISDIKQAENVWREKKKKQENDLNIQ